MSNFALSCQSRMGATPGPSESTHELVRVLLGEFQEKCCFFTEAKCWNRLAPATCWHFCRKSLIHAGTPYVVKAKRSVPRQVSSDGLEWLKPVARRRASCHHNAHSGKCSDSACPGTGGRESSGEPRRRGDAVRVRR
jgi:hypothetical protein